MKRILIVKFGALGDVVRTAYMLPGLVMKHDSPQITWLTAGASAELLRFNPYVCRLATPETWDEGSHTGFDLAISLDDEMEALRWLGNARCHRVTGAFIDGEGRPNYTDDAAAWFGMGLLSRFGKENADQLKKANRREHNQILAAMLGIEIERPLFFNSPYLEKQAAERFDRRFFNIGLNSGAGGRWPAKELPVAETVRLIEGLLALKVSGRPVRVYLLGGREEAPRHARLRQAVAAGLFDAGNENTLLEFAAIVRQCDYVISSDSLALHLAIAQGVRNLSFFAPTSAAEIGTFGTGAKVISTAVDYCSYRPDADNSTLTTERLLQAFVGHVAA